MPAKAGILLNDLWQKRERKEKKKSFVHPGVLEEGTLGRRIYTNKRRGIICPADRRDRKASPPAAGVEERRGDLARERRGEGRKERILTSGFAAGSPSRTLA